MSNKIEGKGSCLCGAVSFTANAMSPKVGACHCRMCRKWGGGPFVEVECGTDVSFEGTENIAVFNSSDWAERGFCRECGSHLFYRLKDSQKYSMPAGLFDDDARFVFKHQVFIDEKPEYYTFANKTTDITGAELYEKYVSQLE